MNLDEIDFQIIKILTKNSRIKWKEIGEQIHMTGQAVGNRIKKLEDNGIIQSYSIIVDEIKLGTSYIVYVTVFMKTTNHFGFVKFVSDSREVLEAHRISGEGCYMLKVKAKSQVALNEFLDKVLIYGNYRVNLSMGVIK